MGTTRAEMRGEQPGCILAPLVGLPALPGGCCCRTTVKGFLKPQKELPACFAVLSTQSEGVSLTQGP